MKTEPYVLTSKDAAVLLQELKHLQLEVSRKKHYAFKVKELCEDWKLALEKQEKRIDIIQELLNGIFDYNIEVKNTV